MPKLRPVDEEVSGAFKRVKKSNKQIGTAECIFKNEQRTPHVWQITQQAVIKERRKLDNGLENLKQATIP